MICSRAANNRVEPPVSHSCAQWAKASRTVAGAGIRPAGPVGRCPVRPGGGRHVLIGESGQDKDVIMQGR